MVVRTKDEEAAESAKIVEVLKSYRPSRSRSPSDMEDSSIAWNTEKESWEDAPETQSCTPAALEDGTLNTDYRSPNEEFAPTAWTSLYIRTKAWNTSYVRYNIAIMLATCVLMIPVLTWIALPSLFIITGQREQIEAYFYVAYFGATALAELAFFATLRTEQRKVDKETFRDTLDSAVFWMAVWLGLIIIFALFARVVWPILRIIWAFLSAIWGGMPVFRGPDWSMWDDIPDENFFWIKSAKGPA